jgi:RimJ/RimL family protein N-acetyltransferase
MALPSRPVLAALAPAHAADFARLAGDPAVAGPVGYHLPFTLADAEAFVRGRRVAAQHRRAFTFAILVDGAFVGGCSLHSLTRKGRSAEVGFWVGRPYWRRGYAVEAVAQLLPLAFLELQLGEVHARCLPDNHGASAVLRGHGFRRQFPQKIGELASHALAPLECYVLAHSEWLRDHGIETAGV